jgi:hypothetical protein
MLVIFTILPAKAGAQGIVNTEAMLTNASDIFKFDVSINGNLSIGNIKLYQGGAQLVTGLRKHRHLYRVLLGYDYLRSDEVVNSSDVFSQIRYNYYLSKHSLFAFYQVQNTRSLKLKSRQLLGSGIRFRLFEDGTNYIDTAPGILFEDEFYNLPPNSAITASGNRTLRATSNLFVNVQFSTRLRFLNTTYFQQSLKNGNDFKVFSESKLGYTLKNVELNILYRNKFHSAPYLPAILKSDQKIVLGISIFFN